MTFLFLYTFSCPIQLWDLIKAPLQSHKQKMGTESHSYWETNIQYVHRKYSLIPFQIFKNVNQAQKCSYVMVSISLSNNNKYKEHDT